MRARFSILLLVLLVSVADRSPAQQQVSATEQGASKLTKQDIPQQEACVGSACGAVEASKLTKQDIPELVRRAEAGDANAQLLLGHAYLFGYGVQRKSSEAVKWYQKSADQGNAEAQLYLCRRYGFGDGVPKDENEAIKWCRRAAEQGLIDAQVNLGAAYHRQKNYTEAVKWDRKAAEAGDHIAQSNLSLDYAKGDGVPQDYPTAYMWILLARAARCGQPPKLCTEQDPPLDAETQRFQNEEAAHLSAEQIAEARRKASDWLVAHQKAPLPPEGTETKGAMFMVSHKHGGGGMLGGITRGLDDCYGWITISKDQIKYVSKNRDDGFEISPSNVKKVDASIRTTGDFSRPFIMLDVKLVLTDGKKHTFVPVDDRLQRQDPVPLFKALNSATSRK